jgi:transposase
MTYSLDFRQKVLEVRSKEGLTFAEVSARFRVGINSVVRWSKRIESQKTRNKPSVKIDMDALKKDIEEFPDAYQYERGKRLGVSQMGICDALKRLGVTYKKNSQSSQSGSRKTICVLPNT